MIIPIATILLCCLAIGVSDVDARLPPKLLKAVNGVGKALYAGRYGYSMIPMPSAITLQTNVARKEMHIPSRVRRKRRPNRRPQYASKYQDYVPASTKTKHHVRRPPKQKRKPRPPYREHDYYEPEEDESEDYEYDEKPRYEDDDEFVAQHSELYAGGYNSGRKRPFTKYRDDESNYAEQSYVRKHKPNLKSWTAVLRPTKKLYSAAIGLPSRPVMPRDEDKREDEERPRHRGTEKRKKRFREEERYRDEKEEDDYDDNVYHDRTYFSNNAKQKRRERGTEEKEAEHREKLKKKLNSKENTESKWRIREEEVRWKKPEEQIQTQKWVSEPNFNENRYKEEPVWWKPRYSESNNQKEIEDERWPSEIQTKYSEEPKEWSSDPTLKPLDVQVWTPGPVSTMSWLKPQQEEPDVKNYRRKGNKKRNVQKQEPLDHIVTQRVVSDTMKWTEAPQNSEEETSNWNDGEIVYGSRIKDNVNWRKEMDIGYGKGMEVLVVDDKVAGWQVY